MKRSLRTILTASVIGLAALSFAATSNAAPVSVSAYDVTNTQGSGFGGWSHFYTGMITNNLNGTVNETGGSGTLNDGLIGTSYVDTHLFYNSMTNDNTSFDLYLSQSTYVTSISLYSFFDGQNAIPGNITGLYVTINGNSGFFNTTGFGPMNFTGVPVHELINLAGSGLDTLLTNQITLWGFVSTGGWAAYSSISEVVINEAGNPTPAPEPSTMILLGTGIAAVALFRKRFKRS